VDEVPQGLCRKTHWWFLAWPLLLYCRHLGQHKHPILNFNAFSDRTFKYTAIGSFLFRLTAQTIPFLIPLMLQATYGFSAVHSGAYTLPALVGALLSRKIISKISLKFGYKKVLLLNISFILVCYTSYSIDAFILIPSLLVIPLRDRERRSRGRVVLRRAAFRLHWEIVRSASTLGSWKVFPSP